MTQVPDTSTEHIQQQKSLHEKQREEKQQKRKAFFEEMNRQDDATRIAMQNLYQRAETSAENFMSSNEFKEFTKGRKTINEINFESFIKDDQSQLLVKLKREEDEANAKVLKLSEILKVKPHEEYKPIEQQRELKELIAETHKSVELKRRVDEQQKNLQNMSFPVKVLAKGVYSTQNKIALSRMKFKEDDKAQLIPAIKNLGNAYTEGLEVNLERGVASVKQSHCKAYQSWVRYIFYYTIDEIAHGWYASRLEQVEAYQALIDEVNEEIAHWHKNRYQQGLPEEATPVELLDKKISLMRDQDVDMTVGNRLLELADHAINMASICDSILQEEMVYAKTCEAYVKDMQNDLVLNKTIINRAIANYERNLMTEESLSQKQATMEFSSAVLKASLAVKERNKDNLVASFEAKKHRDEVLEQHTAESLRLEQEQQAIVAEAEEEEKQRKQALRDRLRAEHSQKLAGSSGLQQVILPQIKK